MMVKRVLAAVVLMAAGAAVLALLQLVWVAPVTEPPVAAPPAVATHASSLTLTPEAVTRAGIRTDVVRAAGGAGPRRFPGVVEPNGYLTVDVTTLLEGTVLDVRVSLGDAVRAGAVVARLRSPELTDQIRNWLTIRAERDVVAARLARVTRLAAIGAASTQDLEDARAADVRASTELETARARLLRLGLGPAKLDALVGGDAIPDAFDVVAHASGVVITRQVNPGQNVDAGQPIVTVADLSPVWVMGDVFESELASMAVGQSVQITSAAYPARVWAGRVAYIEPEVARETRTIKVRVEVPNPDRVLKFGMLVSLDAQARASASGVAVPPAAVQTIGAVEVVYVETAPGQYVERLVSDIAAGDVVVTEGSFALRAERERLGWPPPAATRRNLPPPAATSRDLPPPAATRVIEITASGLVPDRVTVPANQAVDLVFIRRVEETCGTELAIPDLGVRRDLPLDVRVTVRLPPRAPGELSFSCGMDMLKGVIIVR